MLRTKLVVVAALTLAGCGSGLDSADTDLVQLVTVSPGPGGAPQVRTEWITRQAQEQLKQRRAARAAQRSGASAGELERIDQAITQGGNCLQDGLWMFDSPDLTGNMLCLLGQKTVRGLSGLDTAALRDYPRRFDRDRGQLYWAGAVRSFWPGFQPGYFRTTFGAFVSDSFQPFREAHTVSSAVRDAGVVSLQDPSNSVQFALFIARKQPPCPPRIPFTLTAVDNPADTMTFDRPGGDDACRYTLIGNLAWGEAYKITADNTTCFVTLHDVGVMSATSSPPDSVRTFDNNDSATVVLPGCGPS